MGFVSTVHYLNMQQLMESDFQFDVTLSFPLSSRVQMASLLFFCNCPICNWLVWLYITFHGNAHSIKNKSYFVSHEFSLGFILARFPILF